MTKLKSLTRPYYANQNHWVLDFSSHLGEESNTWGFSMPKIFKTCFSAMAGCYDLYNVLYVKTSFCQYKLILAWFLLSGTSWHPWWLSCIIIYMSYVDASAQTLCRPQKCHTVMLYKVWCTREHHRDYRCYQSEYSPSIHRGTNNCLI